MIFSSLHKFTFLEEVDFTWGVFRWDGDTHNTRAQIDYNHSKQSNTCFYIHKDKFQSIMQVSRAVCVCVCLCVPIITDESGVIWLKCNNTVQIWHNPAHPSNWPVEWQSGRNFPNAASDLSSFKILWSQWGMRGACYGFSSLQLCPYLSRYVFTS